MMQNDEGRIKKNIPSVSAKGVSMGRPGAQRWVTWPPLAHRDKNESVLRNALAALVLLLFGWVAMLALFLIPDIVIRGGRLDDNT